MITINLDFQIKDLNGELIAEELGGHAGKLIGNKLVGTNSSDFLKWFDWGRMLHSKKEINVDKSDFELIKDFVKNHKEITVLAKAPIMEYLNTLKEE